MTLSPGRADSTCARLSLTYAIRHQGDHIFDLGPRPARIFIAAETGVNENSKRLIAVKQRRSLLLSLRRNGKAMTEGAKAEPFCMDPV